MAALWQRFADLFPFRWLSAVGEWSPTSTAVAEWRATLRGITARQLADGLDRLRRSGAAWPPSAPEFRALCLPAVPAEIEAFREAVLAADRWGAHQWSHPVVYTAASIVGTWTLRTASANEARSEFRKAFAAASARWQAGEALVAPSAAPRIGKPEHRRAPDDVARASMDAIRRELGQ